MRDHFVSVVGAIGRHPGPRFASQGDNSGELFRRMLVRELKRHDRIIVDLDGTSGFGSSFLDEAFGGLVRKEGFSVDDVRERVRVKSDLDKSYLVIVEEALRDAEKSLRGR